MNSDTKQSRIMFQECALNGLDILRKMIKNMKPAEMDDDDVMRAKTDLKEYTEGLDIDIKCMFDHYKSKIYDIGVFEVHGKRRVYKRERR